MKQRPSFVSGKVGRTAEVRREALKRFGRYAAAAPTAMLLLVPRAGDARPKHEDHIPPGQQKKKDPVGGYQ
jgi:hypothetical protein